MGAGVGGFNIMAALGVPLLHRRAFILFLLSFMLLALFNCKHGTDVISQTGYTHNFSNKRGKEDKK